MLNLYDKNGLIFWSECDIAIRRIFEIHLRTALFDSLRKQNAAFQIMQCEAPLLTPLEFINKDHIDDIYKIEGLGALRPETTAGSFEYAKHILSGYYEIKQKPPLIIWQHGKSFRCEQDQPIKHMRLKEFYQLEFQVIFAENTLNDYSILLYKELEAAFNLFLPVELAKSERRPFYSQETIDIIHKPTGLELASMSKRTDLPGYKVIEIAIGTDRCIYAFTQGKMDVKEK